MECAARIQCDSPGGSTRHGQHSIHFCTSITRTDMTCLCLSVFCVHFRCRDVTETCHRFLDLTGPFQLGGLSSFASSRAVRTSGFVGCIRDLYIDEHLIDLASYVWNNGTVEGCAAKARFCQSSPCQNSGLTALHVNELASGQRIFEERPHHISFRYWGLTDLFDGAITEDRMIPSDACHF